MELLTSLNVDWKWKFCGSETAEKSRSVKIFTSTDSDRRSGANIYHGLIKYFVYRFGNKHGEELFVGIFRSAAARVKLKQTHTREKGEKSGGGGVFRELKSTSPPLWSAVCQINADIKRLFIAAHVLELFILTPWHDGEINWMVGRICRGSVASDSTIKCLFVAYRRTAQNL